MAPRQSRPNWMQVVDHFRQFGSLSDGSKVMDRSLRHFVQSQASEMAAARDPSKRTRVVVYIGNMKVCHVSFMCSSICGLAKVAARIKERARATEARAKAIGPVDSDSRDSARAHGSHEVERSGFQACPSCESRAKRRGRPCRVLHARKWTGSNIMLRACDVSTVFCRPKTSSLHVIIYFPSCDVSVQVSTQG